MSRFRCSGQAAAASGRRRRGSVVVLAAFLLVFVLGCMAFTIDLGYLFVIRTQAQSCADASALAAAWEMASDRRVRRDSAALVAAANAKAIEYAAMQDVSRSVGANNVRSVVSEVRFGWLGNPNNQQESISFPPIRFCNTVLVRIACTPEQGTPVPLFFAQIFGADTASITAEAAATFQDDNTIGFEITDETQSSTVMPFAVRIDQWLWHLAIGHSDQWSYDPDTKTVSRGGDGIPELKIFPEKKGKGGGITPGNFGTVDIGRPNNAAPDLWRQIREGPNADDLEAMGGSLQLDPHTRTLQLNGDPGMTASMKHALEDIVGQPRTILLYNHVQGQGNNTWFTVCGFAGVRVVDFKMTGNDKYILVQPAVVVDETAISGPPGTSWYVGQPIRLVR